MLIPAEAVAQRRYARSARTDHPTSSLGIGPAILRGMRDLGYRDSAAAICALVDNAIDGQAREVDIIVETIGNSIKTIAIVDNGVGMVPEMLRAAAAVGVSCRLGDGPHLARAGFGLPSAPIAVGRRFSLISRPAGHPCHGLLFDLGSLQPNDLLPDTTPCGIPPAVARLLDTTGRRWLSGTIIVIGDLDRLSPVSPKALRSALHQRLGLTFRNFLHRLTIRVDGEIVTPIDPLFLAAASAKANDAGQFQIDIDNARLTVRTALLAPINSVNLARYPNGSGAGLSAAQLARETNGLIITRGGRHVTTLPSTPLFSFSPSDWPIRVEIDFDPELDELLAPSLSLQSVQVSNTIWTALRQHGVSRHLDALRRQIAGQRQRQRMVGATSVDYNLASSRRRNRCQKEG